MQFELVQHHVIRCSTGQPMLIPARFLWSVDPAGASEPGPTFADRLTREPNVSAGHIRFSQSVTSDLSSSSITTPTSSRIASRLTDWFNPSDISSEANRLCDIPCDCEALSNRALTPAGNRTTRAFFASFFSLIFQLSFLFFQQVIKYFKKSLIYPLTFIVISPYLLRVS